MYHLHNNRNQIFWICPLIEESKKLVDEMKNKKFKEPTFIECDLINIKLWNNHIHLIK